MHSSGLNRNKAARMLAIVAVIFAALLLAILPKSNANAETIQYETLTAITEVSPDNQSDSICTMYSAEDDAGNRVAIVAKDKSENVLFVAPCGNMDVIFFPEKGKFGDDPEMYLTFAYYWNDTATYMLPYKNIFVTATVNEKPSGIQVTQIATSKGRAYFLYTLNSDYSKILDSVVVDANNNELSRILGLADVEAGSNGIHFNSLAQDFTTPCDIYRLIAWNDDGQFNEFCPKQCFLFNAINGACVEVHGAINGAYVQMVQNGNGKADSRYPVYVNLPYDMRTIVYDYSLNEYGPINWAFSMQESASKPTFVPDPSGKEYIWTAYRAIDGRYKCFYDNDFNYLADCETDNNDVNYQETDMSWAVCYSTNIYTGRPLDPVTEAGCHVRIKGTNILGQTTLVKGKDYIVHYENNINVGEARYTVEGIGKYHGIVTSDFTISPASIYDSKAKIAGTHTYSGKAIKPKVDLTFNGIKLVEGTDYTVAHNNNINAGYAEVVVNGKGNFYGMTTVLFKINAKKVTPKVVLKKTSATYTGNAVKPGVKSVKIGSIPLKSTQYKVSYKNNKAVGKATVTVTLKGNYSGSTKATFKIVPKKTANVKLKALSKGMKVSWKAGAASQASGYEVRYATSKSAVTKAKAKATITKRTTASKTFKNLKAGKKYYVQVRTYKKVGGVKYYSDWSAVKTVTIKK